MSKRATGLVIDGYAVPRDIEAAGGPAVEAWLSEQGWSKPELTEAGLMERTKAELIELAGRLEVDTGGTKADIVARILGRNDEQAGGDDAPVDETS